MTNSVTEPLFLEARYGSYLLIPLKYDRSTFDISKLRKIFKGPIPIRSKDISDILMQTYKYILTACDIPAAVSDLSLSIHILDERERELEEKREKKWEKSNRVLFWIALFGIITIPESLLTTFTYFVEKQWLQGILNCGIIAVFVVIILILFFGDKKK